MTNIVSVIIPCFNSLPFLKDILTCLHKQTYLNLEIILVDDGSTDGSFEYVQNLGHPNLTLVKNKG